MSTYEIIAVAGCVVLLAMIGCLVWVVHLAQVAEKESQEAKAAASATATATEQRAMAEAQISAAPTDEALATSLTEGTF